MGQFDRSACFALSAIDNCDLNFIANQNYPLLYHVGTFENDVQIVYFLLQFIFDFTSFSVGHFCGSILRDSISRSTAAIHGQRA